MVKGSLILFRGCSPAMRSLRLSFVYLSRSGISGLIFSFPPVKDLSLACSASRERNCVRGASFISPGLTGSLGLRLGGGIQPIASQLLDLPNGLNPRSIAMQWFAPKVVGSTADVVSRCCHNLRFLEIDNTLAGAPCYISALVSNR